MSLLNKAITGYFVVSGGIGACFGFLYSSCIIPPKTPLLQRFSITTLGIITFGTAAPFYIPFLVGGRCYEVIRKKIDRN
jgi:ABC-type transport system involved in multi-copper enzyme maturation permease subunit